MPEANRRRLAAEVARLHKTALKQDIFSEDAADDRLDPHHTSVALVATASLAELQRLGWWGLEAASYEALAARRPSWLTEAMELVSHSSNAPL